MMNQLTALRETGELWENYGLLYSIGYRED